MRKLKVIASDSSKGCRDINQDSILIQEFENGDVLLAVADGMGGGVMGKELSALATNELKNIISKPPTYPLKALKDAIYKINFKISETLWIYDIKNRTKIEKQKGGTTLCAVYYRDGKIFYINIGDSRVSICGYDKLLNLSIDQNLYTKKGFDNLDREDKDKSKILYILGISSDIEIEKLLNDSKYRAMGIFDFNKFNSYNKIILSTDGFHNFIDINNFCKNYNNFDNILKEVKNISDDNITYIIAKEEVYV